MCFGGQSRHYAGKQNGKEHRQDGKQKPALVRAIQDVVRECIAKDLESKSVNSVNFQCTSAQERTAADDLRGNLIQAGGQQGQYNTQPRCNQDKRKPIQTIGPNTVIRDALDYVHQKPPAKAGKRNKRGGQSGRDLFVPGTVIGKTDAEEKKRQPRKQHEPDIREKWYRKRRTEEKQQNFSAQGRILTKRYKKEGMPAEIADGAKDITNDLAGNKANNWWLRQHEKVLNLPFVDKIGRPDRDNTIDVYISDEADEVLAEGRWQQFFKTRPEPLTREEKRAWLDQLTGVSLGSDAFFPFGDNIERAHRSGVQYVAEPGGSIRDDNVIAVCDSYDMVMCFTHMRLFHH